MHPTEGGISSNATWTDTYQECWNKRKEHSDVFKKYLESKQTHPSWQLEENAVLDSIPPYLGVQHGDQAGQRSCATISKHTHTVTSQEWT